MTRLISNINDNRARYVAPVEISSSLTVTGSITLTDSFLKFKPTNVNINTNESASYIYVSGSTQDLYFSQNGSGFNNVTRLRWLEGNLYTGLLHGGLITSQSSTMYQISSGSGIIVKLNATIANDPYPIVQYLEWNNLSASIASSSASFDWSFVAITASGATAVLTSKGTPYENGEYNTNIPIGIVLHQNRSTINGVQTFPGVAYGWKQRSFDFIRAFGPLKIAGYNLAPSASSTGSLVLSGGTSFVDGRNYTVDPNNPNYIVEANGITTSKIFRYHSTGSTWVYNTNNGAGFGAIDPTRYSNNGVLTSVPTNDWTIQRVFYFPNSATKAFFIYYGNATYSTKENAIAGLLTETFNEAPNTAANSIFIGYMLLRYNANFTTAASYEFRSAGLFRTAGIGGTGGGGGTTTPGGSPTQIQYNNVGTFGGVQTLVYDGTTLHATGSFSGSLIGTATSASFASTASYVNQLQQNVEVTGSITAKQTGFNASGIFTGDTIGAILLSTTASNGYSIFTLGGTLQIYDNISAATRFYLSGGNLGLNKSSANSTLDVNGNITATSITSSGAIIAQANNAMYFRGGDDAEFWDINIANTVGIRGQQDDTKAAITLGKNGPTIFGSGSNVGIGTTSPSERLHIEAVGNSTDTPLYIRGTSTKGGSGYLDFLQADNTGGSNGRKFFRINETGGWEVINSDYNNNIFTLDNEGNLNIAGNLTQNSDISLKTNIQTIPNALEKTIQLRGVEYDRVSTNKHEIGLIAQEVEQVFPELVSETNGIKSVAYSNVVSILIESIKELKQEVDDLREQLQKIK